MKRAIIVILIIGAIGAGAGAYYVTHSGTEPNVLTAPITRGDVIDAVAATGTLQAVISVSVGSQVSANIVYLGADFNSLVKKGQVIARLDPTLFQAQVAQSTANLSNSKASLVKDQVGLAYAKLTYTRDQDLRQRGIISQDVLDAAKTAADAGAAQVELDKSQIEQATAQLTTAQTNLDHTIITSPIDGIVTQRSVDVGQTVQASMTAPQLFIIAEDLTRMQVSANIDESDVGRLHPGQDVTFRVDAYPSEDFHGTVAQIRLNPIVVNNVTTYATMVQVPNVDYRLKPGMTANLKVQVAKKSDVLRVPSSALRFRPSIDVFAALNQPVPPEAVGGGGRGGRGQGRGADAQGSQGTAARAASAQGSASPSLTGAGRLGGSQAAGGRGGQATAGDNADRQSRMVDRFKSMSSDEKKQFISRMKDRGQDATPWETLLSEKSDAKTAPATAEFVYKPRYGEPESAQQIDTLFAPVPTRESSGRVWLYIDHQLKPVAVRLGITDGTYFELRSGDLQENTDVVTGVTGLGTSRAPAASATGNPLMPQRGGPGGTPGRGR
jgi:HlyD family secretion protein